MRREIRKAIRQIEQSAQCPKCEIDTETLKEEFYWNGGIRYLRCPECGYKFQIAFKISGETFEANEIPPKVKHTISLGLTDEEKEYLRQAFSKLKST